MINLGDFGNTSGLDFDLSFCEDWIINGLFMNLKQASIGATNAPEGVQVPQMKGQAADADPSFKFGIKGVDWINSSCHLLRTTREPWVWMVAIATIIDAFSGK